MNEIDKIVNGSKDTVYAGLKSLLNNHYLSIREDDAVWISCTAVKLFETIEISKSKSIMDTVFLKSAHNKYLSTDIQGNVYWNKTEVGQFESFIPEKLGEGIYAFKTIFGKYLSVETSFFYGAYLSCKREVITQNCQFKVESLNLITCYIFKSIRNGKMWKVQKNNVIDCTSLFKKSFESFELVKMNQEKVALKSHNETFLSVDGGLVSCSKNMPGEHESFEIISVDDGLDNGGEGRKVMIKTWDGKFIYEKDDRLVSSGTDISNSTREFIMEKILINKQNV